MPLDGSALSLEGHLVGQDSGKCIAADDCGLTTTSEKAITDNEQDVCKSNIKKVVTDAPMVPSPMKRCDSWSSTKAIMRGDFGTVKINPSPTATTATTTSSSSNNSIASPTTTTTKTPSSTGLASNAKAYFFNTEAFEDDEDDEESLLSFVSGVATGNASSECSFSNNNNNSDDDVRSDTSICEILNPIEEVVATTSSSMADNRNPFTSQTHVDHHHEVKAAALSSPAVPVHVAAVTEFSPTHHNQPQSAASRAPTASAPKKATIMQAPLRQSRAPLLPADPTTKYRKIMKTYGFAAIHHVCFTTLYSDHQRYVAALAKADPTLHPSPFPFVKELTAQQHAAGAHACM